MVSLMTSGPIPPHPYYDKTDPKQYVDLPAPKVKREGEHYYQQAQGTVGMVLQVEGQRVPTGYRPNSAKPKDHVAENVRRMRKIQRQSKNREQQSTEPVKALWKSSKYEGVESRVKGDLQKDPLAPRPSSANYLRAHSRTGFIPQSARPASTEPPEEKLTIPKAQSAREVRLVRRELDFIKLNGRGVKTTAMKRSPSATALDERRRKHDEQEKSYRRGVVPDYLNRRRDEWERAEKERVANMPDPDMPPGHRLLPQDERRATLDKLKQTEAELHRQLATMPIRTDTLRVRTRRETLERKIGDVEEAIKIFSRPKVFVKLDS